MYTHSAYLPKFPNLNKSKKEIIIVSNYRAFEKKTLNTNHRVHQAADH